MNNLVTEVKQNVVFVAEFLAVIVIIFMIAYFMEKWEKKRTGNKERILTTQKISMVGMLSAISAILIIFGEIPLPMIAPDFYKLDVSELPAVLGGFALGPVAGIMIELCKILLKVIFKPTTTAFVGELANFAIGCSFVLPASILYQARKSKKMAIFSCVVGTIAMTVFGTVFNAFYLLPKFAQMYGMPLNTIIGMGTAINSSIHDVLTFVVMIVAPLNLVKGVLVSVVAVLIYKPLSPILKEIGIHRR